MVPIAWLLFLCVCFVGGCTESPPENIIRIGLAIAPTNLDPRLATDAPSARVNRLLYSRLVDFADDATAIPALATWEALTPTHYRFVLREPRPTFPEGTPLTAKDVLDTYRSILDPKTASPHRGLLHNIRKINTPSELAIDFFLLHPDPLFPSYLVIGILPANLIEMNHPFHENPVGSGPFLFHQRPDDSRLILKRRHDAQLMEFVKVLNPTVRTLKLLAGEIHLLQNDLPPELVTYLSENPSIFYQHKEGSKFSYIGFNHQDPIVGQKLIRKAIAHAINREQIIQFALGGRARLAQALFPPSHWVGASQLEGYGYDPMQAMELLRQAGFSRERSPTLIYKTSTDPFRLRLATIIQEQLRQVGIHMSIHSHDWGTFYGDIKSGHFQMYSLAWVGLKTPDIFRQAFHSQSVPPQGVNRGRYTDPVTDDLIAKAERTPETNQQRDLYRSLQERLLDTLPYVPLWYEDNVALSTRAIRGYTVRTDGNFDSLVHVQWATPTTLRSQIVRQTDS